MMEGSIGKLNHAHKGSRSQIWPVDHLLLKGWPCTITSLWYG